MNLSRFDQLREFLLNKRVQVEHGASAYWGVLVEMNGTYLILEVHDGFIICPWPTIQGIKVKSNERE